MSAPVVHVADTGRARAFDAGLFGRRSEQIGVRDCHLASGDGIGPQKDVPGALIATSNAAPAAGSGPRGAVIRFPVADVGAVCSKAPATGGAEAVPPADLSGIGRFGYCEHGDGNIVGLIRPAGGE